MNASLFPARSLLFKSLFLTGAFLAGTFTLSPVLAQTEQDADQATDDELVLEEVVVTGIRRSLDFSADIKRDSDQVVDAITAQDIGLFSDNNIGEALSRIPGVLLERDAGEGYRISIRGLGPRFVRTTINGRTALTSSSGENGDDARAFTFSIMPSEVVSKAQVSKSTQAYELEGGIGGTVDLVTNRPLDFKPKGDDFYFSAALRATHNDVLDDERYRGTLFLNKKWGDSAGFFLGYSYDEANRIDNLAESQRLQVFPGDDPGGRYEEGTLVNGVPLEERTEIALNHFSGVRFQEQPIFRDRETIVTGLQFRTENTDINFDWTSGSEDEKRDDKRFWFNLGDMIRRQDHVMTSLSIDYGDATTDQIYPTEGTLVAYSFGPTDDDRRVQPFANGLYRWIPRTSDVDVGGLNVDWNKGDWTIVGDLGFARQNTLRTLHRLRTRLDTGWRSPGQDRLSELSGTYDITSGYPIATVYDANGDYIDPMDVTHQYVERLERIPTRETGEDMSFRLDVVKLLEESDREATIMDEIMFGFAWNEMEFTRRRDAKIESPRGAGYDVTQIGTVVADGILPDVKVPGFVHSFAVLDIFDPAFDGFFDDPEGYEVRHDAEYWVTEENTALYLQGNYSGGERFPYRGNIGIRYTDTTQTNLGWVGEDWGDDFIPADPDNPKVKTSRDYDYWLPSWNLAIDTSENTVLRFAANKSLTRPDPIDLSARIEINDLEDEEDNSAEGGNPDLQPYTTNSLDAILEWYPEAGGHYAIGLFYKELGSYIALGRSPELIEVVDEDGNRELVEYDVRRPVNTDGGTISGLELQWHIPFDSFTDSFLQYFGLNGSYTYVDAKMDAVVPERGTPISLRGTSEDSGNMVLYFEKGKFGVRLAANYRSSYLHQEAEDPDRYDEFTKSSTVVDFNFDYVVNDHMKIRFSANNLTDERRSRYWNTTAQYYSDERDNGQEYVLEFRFSTD